MAPTASEEFVAVVMPALDIVHNLSRRLLRGSLDAEDLAQDTLARAWQAWQRGVRPDSVGAWLSTICLNLVRDRARRVARDREVAWQEGLDPVDPIDVEGVALARVQRGLVETALWDLPEPQRIAIVLMDLCGLSAAEIAEITAAPRGTVLARVHRGRKALGAAVHARARSVPPQAGQRGSAPATDRARPPRTPDEPNATNEARTAEEDRDDDQPDA